MSCENWRMKIYRRIADIMFVEINTLIFHYYFIRKKYHSLLHTLVKMFTQLRLLI